MILPTINKVFVLIIMGMLLTGCIPVHNPYAAKQTCLSNVIAACKQKGWKFATTNPDCIRAADVGIYGLSCDQLMACRAAEQQAYSAR
jgi:hypothetical protein